MEVRAKVDGEVVGRKFVKRIEDYGDEIRDVLRETAEIISDAILFAGAEDISSAGNFGGDWIEALHADINESQRTFTINVAMIPEGPPVTYWKVFEYGATITAHGGLLTWPNTSGYAVGGGVVPQFISKHSVNIPKKFHLHEIVREEAAKTRDVFKKLMQK